MGFLDVLFNTSDKSHVIRFYLEDADSDELARCRKREPLIFRRHPQKAWRVLVFRKQDQGAEVRVGAVPQGEAEHVANHLWQGFICEGTIIEFKGGTCRVKCRLIGL